MPPATGTKPIEALTKGESLQHFRNPVFGDYVIEIRVPAGYKGAAFVQNVPTKNYGIYEMVFKPGARFRVIEVSGNRQVWEAIP
ncbi:MAG: hypothetical protein LBR29_04870 [Methylobacteriaceae bacterium]|jgi:hypothetical protein|nr:hypothetical protein [Methylobacteriaceae bacterium]